MTRQEFSDQFDVLYNNITSNQAPGLDEYEKSVFLTKAQDEIVKSYFNPRLNKTLEGFDGNEKRQIDFSMILKIAKGISLGKGILDNRSNTKRFSIPSDVMMFINEFVDVRNGGNIKPSGKPLQIEGILEYYDKNYKISSDESPSPRAVYYSITKNAFVVEEDDDDPAYAHEYYTKWDKDGSNYTVVEDTLNIIANNTMSSLKSNNYYLDTHSDGYWVATGTGFEYYNSISATNRRLVAIPLDYANYARLSSKPFKRPLKNQAWRIIDNSGGNKAVEIIVGPNDEITNYSIRYVKKPYPIILDSWDSSEQISIDGKTKPFYLDSSYKGDKSVQNVCELDPIIHEEILQRAVELAKASIQGQLGDIIGLGNNSQTNVGFAGSSQNQRQQ